MENTSMIEARKMANYIFSILKKQLLVVGSWGFHEPVALWFQNKPSLKFSVNGAMYSGDVTVPYNEGTDLFDIWFERTEQLIEGVFFDELVRVLHEEIEKIVELNNF